MGGSTLTIKFFKIWLSVLKMYRFELCESTYTYIFFNKYYGTTHPMNDFGCGTVGTQVVTVKLWETCDLRGWNP